MSFFHRATAFTSFGSIPVSDGLSHILKWWFEKLQVHKDLQQPPGLLQLLLTTTVPDFFFFCSFSIWNIFIDQWHKIVYWFICQIIHNLLPCVYINMYMFYMLKVWHRVNETLFQLSCTVKLFCE